MDTDPVAADPGPVTAEGPDRRARHRERTHRALVDAALDLFAAEGYEAVSVERIADAAGVSPRTFFRYFAAKEDVVFADYEAEFDVWDRVTVVPRPGEPLLETIRRGTREVGSDYRARRRHWDRWFALVAREPALQRRMLESRARLQRRATLSLARLLDTDPDDPRPAALAAAAMTATDSAMHSWYASGQARPRDEVVDEALDALLDLSRLLRAPVPIAGPTGAAQ